jgi:hypothetical protein
MPCRDVVVFKLGNYVTSTFRHYLPRTYLTVSHTLSMSTPITTQPPAFLKVGLRVGYRDCFLRLDPLRLPS